MLRRYAVAGIYVLGLCFVAAPAMSQQAPADALPVARELITVIRATDQFKLIFPTILQSLKPAIVQGRPQIERDFDAMVPVLLEGANSRINEITDQMAGVYARTFTVEEIRQLIVFYRTPVGQKLLEKLPTVMQESMSIGQAWGRRLATDLRDSMVEALRKIRTPALSCRDQPTPKYPITAPWTSRTASQCPASIRYSLRGRRQKL
jgi:hypothetical protein